VQITPSFLLSFFSNPPLSVVFFQHFLNSPLPSCLTSLLTVQLFLSCVNRFRSSVSPSHYRFRFFLVLEIAPPERAFEILPPSDLPPPVHASIRSSLATPYPPLLPFFIIALHLPLASFRVEFSFPILFRLTLLKLRRRLFFPFFRARVETFGILPS